MATVKPSSTLPPRRRGRTLVALAVLAAAFALAWYWQPLTLRADTAASYGARIACGCRFIEGRPLDQCRDDFVPGMGMVSLSEDAERKSVTARVPLLASQTVNFRGSEGCIPDAWDD